MTKERFKQLWKALVEDAPRNNNTSTDESLLPSNGVSDHLKKSLLDNSGEDGRCLAMNVPND